MIFGMQSDKTTLIVAAADSVVELEAFYAKILLSQDRNEPRLYSSEFQPSPNDMLLDDRFWSFKKPPYVFEFDGEETLKGFVEAYNVSVRSRAEVVDRHKKMLEVNEIDPYLSPNADTRTIEEILGIEENDPWDTRSEEQKQQDEENRKKAEEMKKAGKLSGDSFGPGKKRKKKKSGENEVGVTDIRVSRNEDGTVNIDEVLAVKGLYDDNGKGAWLPAKEEKVIADAEVGEHFYRFSDLDSIDIDEVLHVLGELADTDTDEERNKIIVLESSDNTWFVVRGERLAHKLAFYLDNNGIVTMDVVDAKMTVIKPFIPDASISQHISPGGYIAIYHRVDVAGDTADLHAIVKTIEDESIKQNKDLMNSIVAARGYYPSVVWFACATKLGAEEIERVIKTNPAIVGEIEVYGVNDLGERFVPKGIQIVEEEDKPEPPRPWNERAAEWEAMTAEERKKDDVRIHGDEFIFCGNYRGAQDGTICYITPKKYFREHGEMWYKELTIVDLPQDLKQLRPGVFVTKSRDYLNLLNSLVRLGMDEDMALQLYINML